MNDNLIFLVEECDRLGFRIVAAADAERGRDVMPGGLVAVERDSYPHAGRAFATLRWSVESGTGHLYSGHYDLTRAEALADLFDRAGVMPQAARA